MILTVFLFIDPWHLNHRSVDNIKPEEKEKHTYTKPTSHIELNRTKEKKNGKSNDKHETHKVKQRKMELTEMKNNNHWTK